MYRSNSRESDPLIKEADDSAQTYSVKGSKTLGKVIIVIALIFVVFCLFPFTFMGFDYVFSYVLNTTGTLWEFNEQHELNVSFGEFYSIGLIWSPVMLVVLIISYVFIAHMVFLIKGIKHDLSDDNWETKDTEEMTDSDVFLTKLCSCHSVRRSKHLRSMISFWLLTIYVFVLGPAICGMIYYGFCKEDKSWGIFDEFNPTDPHYGVIYLMSLLWNTCVWVVMGSCVGIFEIAKRINKEMYPQSVI